MITDKPLKRQDIVCRKIGDEAVLYNSETRLVHVINHSAEEVWQLCDGRHGIDDIEEALRWEYDIEEKDHVSKDIESILEDFKKCGLLEEADKGGSDEKE